MLHTRQTATAAINHTLQLESQLTRLVALWRRELCWMLTTMARQFLNTVLTQNLRQKNVSETDQSRNGQMCMHIGTLRISWTIGNQGRLSRRQSIYQLTCLLDQLQSDGSGSANTLTRSSYPAWTQRLLEEAQQLGLQQLPQLQCLPPANVFGQILQWSCNELLERRRRVAFVGTMLYLLVQRFIISPRLTSITSGTQKPVA
mmetsp:Transcript_43117/g.93699  ORF Transcript_43117/g.93699 Transcript_43117/m.93699 type:complete len:202 (-) Transcript_43117:1313-1918(-)